MRQILVIMFWGMLLTSIASAEYTSPPIIPPPSNAGRYQVFFSPPDTPQLVLLVDTMTGDSWRLLVQSPSKITWMPISKEDENKETVPKSLPGM